jgi:ribonuclease HI
MTLQIFTDGASKGNPGESGAGAVIFQDGKEIKRITKYLGKKTNNEAEYQAVIEALKEVVSMKTNENILLFSDSEFLVRQLKGEYAVKAQTIKPLFEQVDNLRKNLQLKVQWVPRDNNKIADELANLAITNKNDREIAEKTTSTQQQTILTTQKKNSSLPNTSNPESTSIVSTASNVQTSQSHKTRSKVSGAPKLLVDKAFFGKINCLKIQFNSDKECYFHLGLEKNKVWDWQKVKMNSSELGDIIHLLKKEEGKCSFFHSFGTNKTQIWCNKSEKGFSIKIGSVSKNIATGEAEVLRIILEEIIKKTYME